MSDTHNQHRKVVVPDGDVFIHAGDISYQGEITVLKDFVNWLCELPHKHKIFIAGNHELTLEDSPHLIKMLFQTELTKKASVHFLHDSGVNLDGISYWGSPFSSWFHDWAFNLPEHDAKRDYAGAKAKWNQIPLNTNVLITHGPARNIMDYVEHDNMYVGCPVLRHRIFNDLKELKLSICGHIHQGYGIQKIDDITFINAATCNEQYKPVNPPIVYELPT